MVGGRRCEWYESDCDLISDVCCRRRSTYPQLEDFRCEGRRGPPCTVFREDTVTLDVTWANPGVQDMTQSTHWVSWIDLPWVGMETEACPYLDGGHGCSNSTVTVQCNNYGRKLMKYLQARQSTFNFPIYIEPMYPAGNLQGRVHLSHSSLSLIMA